jgi:Family of unknown function (DUF6804)
VPPAGRTPRAWAAECTEAGRRHEQETRSPLLTKTMKWVSITMLLLALFWQPLQNHHVALEILVCIGALLVVTQAWSARKYFWASGFVAIAVLFNPIVPLVLTRRTFFLLELACLSAFLLSLTGLTAKPLIPAPGIINPNRQIQSQFH